MALEPTTSTQRDSELDYQNKKQGIYDGGLRCAYAKYTCTTAGVGTIDLLTLPPGRIMIHNDISRILSSDDFVTNADLHLGHAAYVNQAGTAVVADDNEWFDNEDCGGGAIDKAFGAGVITTPISEYNSQGGILVQAMVDTANVSIGATIEVLIYYTKEGSA